MAREDRRGEVAGAAVMDPPAPAPAPVAETYFIGLTSLCPFERLVLCGQEFCLKTEAVNFKAATGETQRLEQRGRLVKLRADKLEKIKARALEMVIERTEVTPDPTTNARRSIGMQWDKRRPDYEARENHQPFAAYIYIQPVPAGFAPNRDTEPPTLIPFREG